VRYKLGDMIKITARRNDKLNIDIPQMQFHSRVDDIIDIAGFTRLTEKVIWQAIENTGLDYEEWTVRKEVKEKPVLHLYLELRENGGASEEQVAGLIHEELANLDAPYADVEHFMGFKPLTVTLLPPNAFKGYMLRQQAAGADLAHLKPPHVNPSDNIVDVLVHGWTRGIGEPVVSKEESTEAVQN
jgi:hypothetical protein